MDGFDDDFKAPLPSNSKRSAEEKEENEEDREEEEEIQNEETAHKNKMLQFIEDDDEEVEDFDVSKLKRLMNSLQKKIKANQEMRVKYPDQPEKFMDSEIELHGEIQDFSVLGTAPDLYPDFIKSNVFRLIIQLLSHENADIAIAIVTFLHEITDDDNLAEFEEESEMLLQALLKEDLVMLLLQNIERLDEKNKEDSDCVHRSLGIFENMTSLNPDLAEELVRETDLLTWLLKRVRVRQFDQNKLYASEILSIFLQNSEEIRKLIGTKKGIDVVLRSLAYYRNKDPKTSEEAEFMNNLFDCLVASFLLKENKQIFFKEEGIELMVIMLKEKKTASVGAMKILSHCFTGSLELEMCKRFVDQLGLKSLFPKFMKPSRKVLQKGEIDDFEEHTCNVILELLKTFSYNKDDTYRNRVLGKFMEGDMVKLERLVELHEKYYDKVDSCRQEIDAEKEEMAAEEVEITDEEEDSFLLREIDAGLCTLRFVDYLIGQCGAFVPQFTGHIFKLFRQKNRNIEEVLGILEGSIIDVEDIENAKDKIKQTTENKTIRNIIKVINTLWENAK